MADTKSARKAAAPAPVTIGAKLRQAHPWFDTLGEGAKEASVRLRQKTERAKGAKLSPDRLVELSDELEEIQRQINPLENKRKEIVTQLLAHWGHTGIEEIEGTLGKTLISLSFELGVDPEGIKKSVGETVWQKITERMIQPPKLLLEGKVHGTVRNAIERSARVCKCKVSVTAPSSRRGKSGAPDEELSDAA
jgi:hypothetical protein